MHEDKDDMHEDRLEQAICALRDLPIPVGPTSETEDATIARLANAESDRQPATISKKSKTMLWTKRVAAAIVIVALLSGLATWLNPSGSTGTIAFGQVLKYLQFPESATFVMTAVTENESLCSTYMIRGDVVRVESPDGEPITISDQTRTLILRPKKAMAILVTRQEPQAAVGRMKLSPRNIIDRLNELREGAEESLGERQIDGQPAVGFAATQQGVELTIWADPETAYPIRAEIVLPLLDLKVVCHDFVFGVDLDPELFSLTPPAGYTLLEGKAGEPIMIDSDEEEGKTATGVVVVTTQSPTKVDFSEPTEKDVIEFMRLLAEANEGRFPEDLDRYKEITNSWMPRTPEDTEGFSRMMQQHRATQFFRRQQQNMPSGRMGHQYVGWGVKLGEASKPIYVWEHPERGRYRVIFGDLSIRDVTQAEWDSELGPDVARRGTTHSQEQSPSTDRQIID